MQLVRMQLVSVQLQKNFFHHWFYHTHPKENLIPCKTNQNYLLGFLPIIHNSAPSVSIVGIAGNF